MLPFLAPKNPRLNELKKKHLAKIQYFTNLDFPEIAGKFPYFSPPFGGFKSVVEIGREKNLTRHDANPEVGSSNPKGSTNPYLEDHPRTCKWLRTMVIVSPLTGVIPLINGLFMAYKWRLLTTY